MDFTITTIFYLLIGCGAGVAFALREQHPTTLALLGKPLAATLFWPLFVPLLLESQRGAPLTLERGTSRTSNGTDDSLAQAIGQVEHELDAALRSLNAWPGATLNVEPDCFAELRTAWKTQADRVRELDALLNDATFRTSPLSDVDAVNDNLAHSERTRQSNIERLKEIRDRMRHDLLGTIAWVRELVTMIHLARYTGAPASRAEELVRQIATAVAGLSPATPRSSPTSNSSL